MKCATLVVLLAACQAGANDDFPSRPSGGGPVHIGTGSRDAGVGDGGLDGSLDGDGGVSIAGRACLLTNLRDLTVCKPTGAGGLTVSLGAGQGTTAADGTFRLVAPLGAGFTWRVTGGQIITSLMPFGTDNTIPVLTDVTYTELLLANDGLIQDDDHGSVVVRVVRGVAPVTGVTATVAPLADSLTYYDSNNSRTDWNTTGTQGAGLIWVPSVPLPGPTTLTLVAPGGATTKVTAAIERRSITFVTQAVP